MTKQHDEPRRPVQTSDPNFTTPATNIETSPSDTSLDRHITTTPHRHRALLWLPVVAYMVSIFVVSGLSDPPVPSNVPDISLHEAAYFGLTLVTIRAVAGGRWSGVTLRALVLAWFIATAYGASDEWHQSFVANRHAELRDLGADAIGALAATIVVGAWSIIRRL